MLHHFLTIISLMGATAPVGIDASDGLDHDKPLQSAQVARRLPITWHIDGKTIEVPLSTNQLGWMIFPSRDIILEAISQPTEDEVRDGELLPRPARREFPLNNQEKAVALECVDLWIFGNLTEERRKFWLLTLLSERVADAKKRGLSAADEEMLLLAGRGDIKHFFDRIEEVRSDFAAVRMDLRRGRNFLHALIGGGSTLSVDFENGPFGDHSLYARTLQGIEVSHEKMPKAPSNPS